MVVGHIGENSPYYLWDTRSGCFQKIGGLSAGNNAGGWGSISADSRYVSGSTAHTHEIDTRVQRVEIQEKYQFTQVWPYGSRVFAIGKNNENKDSIIVQSFDKGKTWKQNTNVPRLSENGLESICFLNDFTGVIGGWDGLFLYTTNGGGTWSVSPVRPGEQDNVKVYRALSSYNVNQVVALAELQDSKRKVYFSTNGAESWENAVPAWEDEVLSLSNDGKQFYLTTSTGAIYQSKLSDQWALLKVGTGEPLNKVVFYSQKGMAVGAHCLYYTEDGTTWVEKTPNAADNYTDILWRSSQQAYVTTDNGFIYQTTDNGETWEVINTESHKDGDQITDIQMLDLAWETCGSNSVFFTQSYQSKEQVYEMARYDAEADEWKVLGGLGAQSGQNSSSGYFVSGDGQTVGGLAHFAYDKYSFQSKPVGTATVWEAESDQLIDLGSRLDDPRKNSRIEGLSTDGRVAVGFKESRVGLWRRA
ncbi:MAG: WD40/YVTN/BNR-like repeat-containing protein [Parabacteroides sp.]